MNWFHKAVKVTLLALALSTWFFAASASAQTQTPTKTTSPEPKDNLDSDEGWHVGFTPYIWFAGVRGTVGALDHEASVHASFSDIF
jgi:hypothetical protein